MHGLNTFVDLFTNKMPIYLPLHAAVCIQATSVCWGRRPKPQVPWPASHVQDPAVSTQGSSSAQV